MAKTFNIDLKFKTFITDKTDKKITYSMIMLLHTIYVFQAHKQQIENNFCNKIRLNYCYFFLFYVLYIICK